MNPSSRPNKTRTPGRTRLYLVIAGVLVVSAFVFYRLMIPGMPFLLHFKEPPAADMQGFDIREDVIAHAGCTIPVKVYLPRAGHDRTILVIHGVHYDGYNEARLEFFSRQLACMGYAVATPEISCLKNYSIEAEAVDEIEQVALWLLDGSGYTSNDRDDKIGLMGISFSGGLCLSAASRPSLDRRIAYVFAFGGHGNLDRVLQYLATGTLPDGTHSPPHVYGQAVLLLKFAHALVPAEELESFRKMLRVYLSEKFEEVQAGLDTYSPVSQRLLKLCLDRNTDELGKVLLPQVTTFTAATSLSPVKMHPPPCPLFLLHGKIDNVIPPSETLDLNKWAVETTPTTCLISPLIQHVELGKNKDVSLLDYWRIIRFWTELLRL